MGEQVAGLRDALHDDADLRALATTPLIVNIMVLAYQGEPASSLPSTGTLLQRRSELLTAYVLRMFTRRRRHTRYQPAETIGWLAWLGRSLFHESQPAWTAPEASYGVR